MEVKGQRTTWRLGGNFVSWEKFRQDLIRLLRSGNRERWERELLEKMERELTDGR